MLDENFLYMFNTKQVLNTFKDQLKEYPEDLEYLFSEIYISYVTLLLMNENKDDFTQNIIERGIKISQALNFYRCEFKMQMILISYQITNKR